MDAVRFVIERRRMFAVTGENPKYSLFNMGTPAEEVVREVEEWATAHPRKTRQSVFLEQWPEAYIHKDGYLDLCPLVVSAAHRDAYGDCAMHDSLCPNCHREFWMQEVE